MRSSAACDLIPRLNAMKFSGALSPEHERINRVHVGVVHGALGKELHEWRPPQVADFVRIKGSGRYAPGQTEDGALADLRVSSTRSKRGFPASRPRSWRRTARSPNHAVIRGRARRARSSRPSTALIEQYAAKSSRPAPLPARLLRHRCRPSVRFGGMEGIVCGPGGRYNTMPDERVDIVDFPDMVRIYMLTILEICG